MHHCSSFSEEKYLSNIEAVMDCEENTKCAMINDPGCNGKHLQMCEQVFRDPRGNGVKDRRQPLPTPKKNCVHVKTFFS